MKSSIIMTAVLSAAFVAGASLSASDNHKSSDKQPAKVVDSGTFGIFVKGKRVGTEKFRIEQKADYSVATSEIKVEDGNTRADQSSEMQIQSNGELRSYSWRSTQPQKEETTIEPKDQLLMEHVVPADQKKMDVPHVLPLTTVILDDNFFSQREILVWRYLATGCLPKQGPEALLMCGPSHFGVLVPHQHLASNVVVELLGRDKITYKGTSREANKIRIDADGVQWFLWVGEPDEQYKVLKMSIPANDVEVVRD